MGAVIIAGRYVPRPPDDNIWDARSRGITSLGMPVGGGFPFKNPRWAFNLDDAAVWYRNGSSFSALRLPAVTILPFSNQRWAFNTDDSSFWFSESAPVSPVSRLVGGNFPFKPKRWTLDYDDATFWQNESVPVPPVSKLVGGNFPFRPSFWKAYDEPAVFYGRSFAVNLLLNLPVVMAPFRPTTWTYNFDDAGFWQNKSTGPSASLVKALADFVPFKPGPWRHYDEAPSWNGQPENVPLALLQLLVAAPFAPVRWKFDYDDAAFWNRNPRSSQTLLISGPPTFFGAPGQSPWHKWNFDTVPSPEWNGGPTNGYSVNQPLPPEVTEVPRVGGGGYWIDHGAIKRAHEDWLNRGRKKKKKPAAVRAVEEAVEVLEEVSAKGLLSALAVELVETIETLPARPTMAVIADIREQTRIIETMLDDDEDDILLMVWALD